jgi:hypothetical protein
VLSAIGLIHAFRITDRGVETVLGIFAAPAFAISYLAGALFLFAFHFYVVRAVPIPMPAAESELDEAV